MTIDTVLDNLVDNPANNSINNSTNSAPQKADLWHTLIDDSLPCANPTLFSALKSQALAKTMPNLNTVTPAHHSNVHQKSSEPPKLIHLCGLPGSGKTTYALKLAEKLPHCWHLQFDHIMQSLPGYQQSLAEAGASAAFALWEKPAAHMGYRLLRVLIAAKRSILFDHSAAHPQHPYLIDHCKAAGYHTEMHYIETPVDTVLTRIKAREVKTGRHTPDRLVHERYALLQHMISGYQKQVDRFVFAEPQPSPLR